MTCDVTVSRRAQRHDVTQTCAMQRATPLRNRRAGNLGIGSKKRRAKIALLYSSRFLLDGRRNTIHFRSRQLFSCLTLAVLTAKTNANTLSIKILDILKYKMLRCRFTAHQVRIGSWAMLGLEIAELSMLA